MKHKSKKTAEDCMEIIKLNKEHKLYKIFLFLVNKKDIILYMRFV